MKQSIEDYEELIARTGLPIGIDIIRSFEELKLREQEVQIEKKTQELLVDEGQLLHRRTELEHRQEQLCVLLNATPREFDDTPMSLLERNTKLQDHIQMLNDLREHRLGQIASYYSVLKEHAERLDWTPNSSTIVHLFQRDFYQCLRANALNEIETTLHEVRQHLSEFFSINHRASLVRNAIGSSKGSFCPPMRSTETSPRTLGQRNETHGHH